MGWYNSNWQYRKGHLIYSATGAGTGYQVKIKVYYGSGSDSGENVYLNGHCKTNFGDVRFTDDDGETALSYWMQEKTDSDYAIFWVKINDDLSSNNAIIYIYYGNSSATTTSNGHNTFLFYDDFETGDFRYWDEYTSGKTKISTDAKEGTYCAFFDTDAKGYVSLIKRNIPEFKDSVVEFWLKYSSDINQRSFYQLFYNTNETKFTYLIKVGQDGNSKMDHYYSNTRHYFNRTFSAGTWYAIRYIVNATNNTIQLYRSASGFESMEDCGSQAFKYSDGTNVTNLTVLWFKAEDDTFDDCWVDTVRIRKYVSPGPSHGNWEAEQSVSYKLSTKIIRDGIKCKYYKLSTNIASDGIRYEYYNTGDNSSSGGIYGPNWRGQTFTVGTVGPNKSHLITAIKLKIYRVGNPGTITVSIRAVDNNGLPVGDDLCTGTFDGNNITTDTSGAWYRITIIPSFILEPNLKYAIIIKALNGDSGNYVRAKYSNSGTYTGGIYVSTSNSGGSWTTYTNYDLMFEVWGIEDISPPTPPSSPPYERYNTGDNSNYKVYSNYWIGQKFTVGTVGSNTRHAITAIRLKMFRVGNPGTVTVSIRLSNTGSDLSTGTLNANNITTSTLGQWCEISMIPYILEPNTSYYIIIRAINGDGSNQIGIRYHTDGTYTGGFLIRSSNSGVDWIGYGSFDMVFQICGVDYYYPSPYDDLSIYYGNMTIIDRIDCKCTRWDIDNYSVIIETWLKKDQATLLRNNIVPGATGELYTILGKPKFYDKTWTGKNTLMISANAGLSKLYKLRKPQTIFVKNYSEHPLPGPSKWIQVKIEGYISGSELA